jgi:heme-degrading monooxygenase HmoA
MIFHIDVVKTELPDSMSDLWRTSVQAVQNNPGFVEGTLHRTHRWLNRDGYQLVSLTRWESHSAYQTSLASQSGSFWGALDRVSDDANLYTVVNQSGDISRWADRGHVIVTNPYRIKADDAARYAQMWDASRKHMETQEGFVNAALFKSIGESNEYAFISRAEWQSEELFMKQFEGKDFKTIIEPLEGIFSICISTVSQYVLNDKACEVTSELEK